MTASTKGPRLRPPLTIPLGVGARLYSGVAAIVNAPGDESQKLFEVAKYGLEFRRQVVDQYVRRVFGLTVQEGPFKGMRYVSQAAGSLFSPKILGSYEQELAPIFNDLARYQRFVDVGCAEGYFAVGSLVAWPQLRALAFDTDAIARGLCVELGRENGVSSRLTVGDRCDYDMLVRLGLSQTLIMIDIEGAEIEFLNAGPAERLREADIIVETHWLGAESTLEFVVDYFSSSHHVQVIEQSARDPALFPALLGLGQLDRFLAHWEGRGPEPWVYARSRDLG